MVITPDGHLLGRSDGEALFKAFLGAAAAPKSENFVALTLFYGRPTIGPVQTQANPTESPHVGRAAICLFLAVSCVYSLAARGRITSGDEWHIYGTTESLVERGSWQIQVEGFDRKYSRYSVLPSLLGVPFYLLARPIAETQLQKASPGPAPSNGAHTGLSRRDILQAAVSLQTPFVTAATAAVLLWGLIRLGVRNGPALATACIFAFGTMALPYSCSMFTQPLAALALACLLMSTATGASRCAGAALFFLLVVRFEFVTLLPVLLIYVWRFHVSVLARVAWLAAGAAGGIGFNMLVNWLRGDDLIRSDYGSEGFTTPMWIGLQGVLLSPGKGLLWFSPVAAIGLALIPWLWRKVPRVGFLVVGFTATCLILVACWWTWHGARSWGPRLLLPIMPVLAMPLAWVFQDWSQISSARRWLLLAAISASVTIQFWGALRSPVSEAVLIMPPVAANENESIYIPQTGPWGVESQDFPDLLAWRLWVEEPTSHGKLVVIGIVLSVIAVIAAWLSSRAILVPTGWLQSAVPPTRTRDLATISAGAAILVMPELIISLLIASSRPVEIPSQPNTSRQLRRLTSGPSRGFVGGHLYAPLTGDYILYEQGPAPMLCYVDDSPIFRSGAENQTPTLLTLKAGFHKIRIQATRAAPHSILSWTMPGLAHYKEPIPELYLVGPTVTWKDRFAISVAHSKWMAWVMTLVVFLVVYSRPPRPANCDPPVGQSLAVGQNG